MLLPDENYTYVAGLEVLPNKKGVTISYGIKRVLDRWRQRSYWYTLDTEVHDI